MNDVLMKINQKKRIKVKTKVSWSKKKHATKTKSKNFSLKRVLQLINSLDTDFNKPKCSNYWHMETKGIIQNSTNVNK